MLIRLRLFMSSYAPLFAVAAIRFDSVWLRVSFALIALFSLLALLTLVSTTRRRVASREVVPTAARDLGSEVSAYIATYLLPFVAVDRPGPTDLAAYAVVFAVLGVVFINSDMIGVNPVLYLLGFRIYGVKGVRIDQAGDHQEAFLVSAEPIRSGAPVHVADLADGVLIAVRRP